MEIFHTFEYLTKKKYLFATALLLIGITIVVMTRKQPHHHYISYAFKQHETDKYHLIFKQKNCQNNLCEVLRFEADLYTKVKEVEKNDVWLMIKLDDIKINTRSILIQKMKELYQKPFLMRVTEKGEIEEFVFEGDPKNYGGLQQTISYLNIPILQKSEYQLTQQDTLGTYEADYEVRQNKIKKRILRYITLWQNDMIDAIQIDSAKFDITVVDTHNWIDTLNGKTRFGLLYNNKRLMTTENSVVVEFKGLYTGNIFAKVEPKTVGKIKKDSEDNKYDIYKEALKEKYKKEFSNITVKDMVNDLDGGLLAYSKLKDYLAIYPEKIHYIVEKFNDLDGEKQSKILGYLALIVDIPQIQNGLINIYQNNDISDLNKVRDIIALGFTKEPTPQTVDFLLQELYSSKKEISNTIILAIGRLSKYDDALIETIVQYYKDGNPTQKQIAKKAMQNGGYDIENFLNR